MNWQIIIGLAAGIVIAVAFTHFGDAPAIGISVGFLLGGIYSGAFSRWRWRQRGSQR